MTPSTSTIVFGLLAVIIALVIARALRRWSLSATDPFAVRDLFMENGRASKGAVVLMGAFAATTWMVVYYALIGKMTEGYFGLYAGAWIAPVVARLITSSNGNAGSPPGPSVTTTTTTQATP